MTVSQLKELLDSSLLITALGVGRINDDTIEALIADWQAMWDYIALAHQSADAADRILAGLKLKP